MKLGVPGFLLAIVVAMVISPDSAFSEEKTRLRSSAPKATFRTWRGATKITKIQLDVKNVGEVEATGITVQVKLPDGSMESLSGPSSLAPKASYTYDSHPYDYVTSSKKLKAVVECSNCYR